MFNGVAKTKAPLLETAPGSEPAFMPPSPTCSVPCEIVVLPLKLLFGLVSTTIPLVAVLLIARLVGPAGWSVKAGW